MKKPWKIISINAINKLYTQLRNLKIALNLTVTRVEDCRFYTFLIVFFLPKPICTHCHFAVKV